MKINNIENAQSFGKIYKVRANMKNLRQFDEAAAPLFRSLEKRGIRAFVRNVSEMYTLTDKDAYEFDRKYAQLMRDKIEIANIARSRKPKDNVIILPEEANIFANNFLKGKEIEPVNSFKNLLVKIFS